MSAIDIIRKALAAPEVTPVTPEETLGVTGKALPEQGGNTGNTGNTEKAGSRAPSEAAPPTRVRLQLVVETDGIHKGVTMLGAIGQTHEQAIESARSRFGSRLLSAQEESR